MTFPRNNFLLEGETSTEPIKLNLTRNKFGKRAVYNLQAFLEKITRPS